MEVMKFMFDSQKCKTKLKNKVFLNNYTVITCVVIKKAIAQYRYLNKNMFSPCPSKQFDKFDKLSIKDSLKGIKKNMKESKRN